MDWNKEVFELSKRVSSLIARMEHLPETMEKIVNQLEELRKDNLINYRKTHQRVDKVEQDIDNLAKLGRIHIQKLEERLITTEKDIMNIKANQKACSPILSFFKSPKWIQFSVIFGVIAMFVKESRDIIIQTISILKFW